MATNVLGILVNLTVRGREQVKGLGGDLDGLNKEVKGAQAAWQKYTMAAGAAVGAIAAVGVAAKAAWGALQQGAAVDLTRRRFDNLTESIGVTSAALMGELRAATSGLISDMDLMSSASQIISLKLADNSDQVVRLAAVSGQLGWDMQQVILTFANMSTLRLDALGLSVEEVTTKAKELEAAGMSAQQAFKEAVIQAGESRLGTLDSEADTASGALKTATAALQTMKQTMLESVVVTLDQAGAFDALTKSANNFMAYGRFAEEMERLYQAGLLTNAQIQELDKTFVEHGAAAMEVQKAHFLMVTSLHDVDGALTNNGGFWQTWATSVAIQNQYAADMVRQSSNQMIASAISVQDALNGVTYGPAVPPDFSRQAALRRWAGSANARARQEDSRIDVREMRGDYDRAAASVRGYGGGVSFAISQEEALAASHARLADAFTAELTAKPEDGLINAEGLVNVEAMNDALYQQAQAAGASAVELAMLGIATGKFTKEQAQAALKAAILQEQIRKVAEGVAGGNIKYDAAVGYLEQFRQTLDASGGGAEDATTSVEQLVGMAKELTEGPYAADINANTTQAQADLQAILDLINGISGVHHATIVVDDDNPAPAQRAAGGPVRGGRPYFVGENGPELFVPGNGGGYVIPNSALTGFQSAGSSMNISITNVVEGRVVGRTQLDDITTDTLLHALRSAGVA